ncbi:MAG: TonB-dependent receptor [Myxococcales bacterium]|nr:TonB-dependent receptor [Myxococcales bacterium]
MNPLMPTMLAMLVPMQVAEARETGAIQGVVEDEDGLPVPNATVLLSGINLQGERTATTRDDGSYRFDGVNPGTYELSVTLNDALLARAEVRVALQTTTSARITANMGGVSEEISVVFKPVVDTTQTAFSTSLGADAIQNLPVGRSYQSVAQTIPGVTGRINTSAGGAGNGNPSVRGEGQYGNNYTLDGVSTRDPATKTFGVSLNFDAIEEIQVYTDGAPAEFGQFTGMQVNVVTKDGGDEHHGSAAVFYTQHAWFNDTYPIFDFDTGTEVDTTKAKSRIPVFNGTAGGPIIKEKLWYFAALDLVNNWIVPEGVDEENAITSQQGRFMGKLTWFPADQLTLRYLFIGDYEAQANWDASQFVLPEATEDRIDWTISNTLTAEWQPSPNDTFELRAGFTNINIDIVPSSGDLSTPGRLTAAGVRTDNAFQFDYNDRNRLGGGLVYERLIQNLVGDHKIRAGVEQWITVAARDIQNTGETTITWEADLDGDGVAEAAPAPSGDGVSTDQLTGTRYLGREGLPCEADDYSDCGSIEYWTNVGRLANRINTTNLFVQDEWRPNQNLTINLGVRLDIEDGRNDMGERPPTQLVEEFNLPLEERSLTCDDEENPNSPGCYDGELGPLIMPAPRIGVSFDPFGDAKTKVTAHYGQYYDIAGQNLWDWANTSTPNGFVRYVRQNPGEAPIWNNTQDPVSSPLIYDEGMRPARQDKINVGIEREIATDLALGIRGILSRTSNLPEDVDTNLNDWYIMNSPLKERNYRALEITLNKQFDERWQLFGAYTLSESWGHTPGQFELPPGANSGSDGNNVGVYLDDIGDRTARAMYYETGFGWLLDGLKGLGRYDPDNPQFSDSAGYFGYLPYHAFHQIKLNGTYVAPFGTKIGLVYEFSSGNAWQKRGEVGFYGAGYSFPQARGSRFMPAVHWIDLRLAHEIGLGTENRSLEATLDIFNVMDFITPITYFENDAPGFGLTLNRQAPRTIRAGLKFRY